MYAVFDTRFGFTGDALITGAIGGRCARCDPGVITTHIAQIRPGLDVDGSGATDALTEGLLLIRYLFGFSGDALVGGVVRSECVRCTAGVIEAYCNTLFP